MGAGGEAGKSSGCYVHGLGPRETEVSSTEVAVGLSGLVGDQLSGLAAALVRLLLGVVAQLSGT